MASKSKEQNSTSFLSSKSKAGSNAETEQTLQLLWQSLRALLKAYCNNFYSSSSNIQWSAMVPYYKCRVVLLLKKCMETQQQYLELHRRPHFLTLDPQKPNKPHKTAYHSRITALAQQKPKLSIIHDINILTRRCQISHSPSEQEETIEAATTEGEHENFICLAPKHTRSDRNEDYLRNNMSTVKQKIRNKLLKQKVDFADNRLTHSLCRKQEKSSPQREKIDRYNHDFEQYLIRKKISSKCHTLPEEQCSEPEVLPFAGQRQRTWEEMHCEPNSCEQGRLIIVSRMNPQHALTKFKNIVIETARKSLTKSEEAEFLLRRYVNRHFRQGVRSFQQRSQKEAERETDIKVSPIGCLRDRLNQTARKRELKQLRKESIGLPFLLESECDQDFSLQEKFNSKKMTAFLNAEPSRKKVIFSRKNMHSERTQSQSLQAQP